jgi:NADPH-dependent F420 reductase
MARIAFLGGTGPEGIGLAMRFARAGNAVFVGSRTEERAAEAVAKIHHAVPEGDIYGGFNHEGVEKADFVFITVPYGGHADTLRELAEAIDDRIVVDTVVPLEFGEDGPRPVIPEPGSAAEEARELLPKAKIVSAFHHLDAATLQHVDKPMQGDVVVCGDHRAAKKKVMSLVEEINYIRALDGGALANSRITEQITCLLIHINRIYKVHSGIRITGV